ncbi:hypothetical protein Tco_0593397 [Tanacetum coccineum]
MYDSWKSIIELYMMNRQHGRMILESVKNGPLIWLTIKENGVTSPRKYSELTPVDAIQADCDVKATNIIFQRLPPEVYALVSNHRNAKELWERIQLLMQGTSLTKQERECKLYDEFDKFAYKKGETLLMDPNSSLGKICLGEDIVVILSDKVEGSGDWNSLEFQDTANSGQKKETKGVVFYQMDTKEVSNRFVAPCFMNGLEAYDGNKVVKKELIVALRGEIYFMKFIINLGEDDVEPGVIFDDVPLLGEEGLLPFVCKMGKSSRNKKRAMENLNFFYQDIGTSSSARGYLTQEEAAKEAIAIRISQKFALLEEERPIIEKMAYHDKYKEILDEVWKDKVELDGKIVNEEEEAVKRIKGEALKEKDDPGAFIFPIRLEGQVNENELADTGLDINTMPYQIYEQLGREDMKKMDRGIMMINHTQAEAMDILMLNI